MFQENDFMTDRKGRSVFRTPYMSDMLLQVEEEIPSCAMNRQRRTKYAHLLFWGQVTLPPASEFVPKGYTSNLPFCLKIGQKVDAVRLGRAVDRVIAENDALRAVAVLEKKNGSKYSESKVRFLKQYHYEIPLKIISGADKEEKTNNAMEILNRDLRTRMDIERDIPLRIRLYQLDENEYWLAFAVHHYICDPTTLSMCVKAVLSYYFNENSAQVFGTDSSFIQYPRKQRSNFREN